MRTTRERCWWLASVVVAAGLAGCSSTSHTYRVSADDGLRNQAGVLPAVEVDLVAVSPEERARWDSIDVSTYFNVGNPVRTSAALHTYAFNNDRPTTQSWKPPAKLQDRWRRGGYRLYVLCNYAPTDGSFTTDRRRLVLQPAGWIDDVVEIVISPRGVECRSQRKE